MDATTNTTAADRLTVLADQAEERGDLESSRRLSRQAAAAVASSLIAAAQDGPHVCREHEDCCEYPVLAASCSRRPPAWHMTAEAVMCLPWGIIPGTHGRVRVTDVGDHVGSTWRTRRVLLDGIAVVEVRYGRHRADASLTVLDQTEERARRARAREESRARARELDAARIEVERALLAGLPVVYCDGQRGGTLRLRGGVHVPAEGMIARLGARLDEGLAYGVEIDLVLDGTILRRAADLAAEAVEDAVASAWEAA